jgi:hypothetical protein
MPPWKIAAVAAACLAAVPALQALAAAPPSVYADYHPSLSDLMTMAVQPRHTKLGLAVRARNWTYANYEAGELNGAFTRISRSIPTYEGKDTPELVAMIAKPIDNMRAAIRARDPGMADRAYAELTDTCNWCHAAQERTYIVIRAPAASPFPDQDFSPRR